MSLRLWLLRNKASSPRPLPQAPLSLTSLGQYDRQGLPSAVKRDTPPRLCASKACLEASESFGKGDITTMNSSSHALGRWGSLGLSSCRGQDLVCLRVLRAVPQTKGKTRAWGRDLILLFDSWVLHLGTTHGKPCSTPCPPPSRPTSSHHTKMSSLMLLSLQTELSLKHCAWEGLDG